MQELDAAGRVIALLRTLDEARVAYGVDSTGEGVRLLPSMYHEGSYAELERCLCEMRDKGRRRLWWHASQRHRYGVERTIVAPILRSARGARFVLPERCELIAGGSAIGSRHAVARVYQWSASVDERAAELGVETIASAMYAGRREQIVLPRDVLERALGLPIEAAMRRGVGGRGRD